MAENQTVKDRIISFLRVKKMGQGKFEKACGLSNGYLSKIKDSFGSKKLEDIFSTFPELNKEWLLTGEGEMLRNMNQTITGSVGGNAINGVGNSINNNSEDLKRLIGIIEEQQRTISTLSTIIKDTYNK